MTRLSKQTGQRQRFSTLEPDDQRPPNHNLTDDGERFAERALTAAATCRQQHRSLFDFLTDLLTAHARGHPLPAHT